jgi:hypothetical protein
LYAHPANPEPSCFLSLLIISANAKAVVKVITVAIIHEVSINQPSPPLLFKILLFLKKIPIPTTALIKIAIDENKPIFAVVLLWLLFLVMHSILI